MQLNFNRRTLKCVQEFYVRINTFEPRGDQIYYTVLVISQSEGNVQVTHKRYSDLKKMHERLTTLCYNCKLGVTLPNFPGRKLFGKTNSNHNSIAQRMQELTVYLNGLFQIERIYDFPFVAEMLPAVEKVDNYLLSLLPETNEEELNEYDREKCWGEMDELKRQFIDKQDLKTCGQRRKVLSQNYIFEIEEYEQLGESVQYMITIRDVTHHDRWQYRTRYRDLRDLHAAIKAENLDCVLPEFPKRKIFTITNENKGLIELRKNQLVAYLNQLFSVPDVQMNDVGIYFIQSTKRFSRKDSPDENKLIQKIKKSYAEQAPQTRPNKSNLNLSLIQEDDKESDCNTSFLTIRQEDL